ncbi:MAG: GNAT family protein [Chloroflexota bacterium]
MLQGNKVILRAIQAEDLPRLWAFNNDLAVELAGGGDPPMPQSLARLEAEFNSQTSDGGRDDASFVIEAIDDDNDNTGLCIGQCALFNFDFVARRAELGITIGDKAYWGKGYGREVTALLVHYGFQYRNLWKICLNVHAKNERAIRAYVACGFVEEGRLRDHVWSDGAYDDLVMMGIRRPDWIENSSEKKA